MRRHKIAGYHRAQRHHIIISAPIAHHAHRLHRQKHRKRLAGQVIPRFAALIGRVTQFLNKNRVRLAQQIRIFALHFAQHAHAQARTRERVAIHHFARQTQRHAQLAHLVFKQIAQRFQQLQFHVFRQPAHIVMRFNRVCLFRFRARRFNHIRINGALRQPFCLRELFLFRIKHFNKFRANDFAFLLRVGNARQLRHKLLARVHVHHLHAQILREHLHHIFALVQAQQAVVHEYAS